MMQEKHTTKPATAKLPWLREQAQQLAQQQQLPCEAFYSGTWAAESWGMAGEPLRCLNLLSELLREVPTEADIYDVWIAKKWAFEVQRLYFPRLTTLQQRLYELTTLQNQHPQLPPGRCKFNGKQICYDTKDNGRQVCTTLNRDGICIVVQASQSIHLPTNP